MFENLASQIQNVANLNQLDAVKLGRSGKQHYATLSWSRLLARAIAGMKPKWFEVR